MLYIYQLAVWWFFKFQDESNDLQAFEAVEEKILHDTEATDHTDATETNGVHENHEAKAEETPVADIIDLSNDAGESF